MSKKSNGSAAVPATQEEMAAAEREFFEELVQLMPTWLDQAGPGVDVAFYGIEQLVAAGDKAAVPFDADEDDASIPARWALLQAMRGALPIAWPRSVTRRRDQRRKLLKRVEVTDITSYERSTVTLIAADIPTWYAKAGIWGAGRTLYETCKIVREVFAELADNTEVPEEDKFFLAAFEIRRQLGKVSEVELQALEFLAEQSATAAG